MTAPKPPALARAAEAIERLRAKVYPLRPSPQDELRELSADLLHELADDRVLIRGDL